MRKIRAIAITAILLGVVSLSNDARAQTVQRIDASKPPACNGCSLILTKVATLGSANDDDFPGVNSESSGLAVDSKGHYFVTSMIADKVLEYDRAGKFLRTIGKQGKGPGEFTKATRLAVDIYDSLYVFDITRITTFSPALAYARTVSLKKYYDVGLVLLGNGTLVVGSEMFSKDPRSATTISANGKALAFGPPATSNCPLCRRHLLSTSNTPNSVWLGTRNSYEFEEWQASGRLLRKFAVVNSSWMRPFFTQPEQGPSVKPVPMIEQFMQDSSQRMWVRGLIATPDWTPPPRRIFLAGTIPLGIGPYAPAVQRLITVIDVIDLARKRVLVSQQFRGRALHMIAAGLIGEVREDPDGVQVWDIFKVEIRKP